MSAEEPVAVVPVVVEKTGNVDVNDLIPFCGVVCCFYSCYLDFPDLIGCAGKSACCCVMGEFACCKLPKDPETWFMCQKTDFYCAQPKACCMQRSQMCCLDVRVSLPPSEEIPCLFTICFFTVCYKSKVVTQFMKPVRDLEAFIAGAAASEGK